MDARDRRGPTTDSSDSSTGEPPAVRRRLDLDGSYTSRLRRTDDGQLSPTPAAAGAGDTHSDESLLDVTLTPQQDNDTDVVSNSFGDSKSILPEDSNSSKEDTGKTRQTSGASDVSDGAVGQQENGVVVVSETSDSVDRSERSDTSAKDTAETSEGAASSSSDSGSGTDAYVESPFGGSSHYLIELCAAYKRASEAIDQEKKRGDSVVTELGKHVTKVSKLTCKFHAVAGAHFGDIAKRIENCDLQRSNACNGGDRSVAFEQRLEAVKAYVCGVFTETQREETGKPAVSIEYPGTIASEIADRTDATSSAEDSRNYTVRKASNSVRKSRNVVVRQRKVMSKLSALAKRLTSKAEISYDTTLNCLRTVAVVLTPAVRTCRMMQEAARKLQSDGQELPAFNHAVAVVSRCTSEALLDAESAVRLHMYATETMRQVSLHVDLVRGYHIRGSEIIRDIMAAADSFLELVQQSNASLAEIKTLESNVKLKRSSLSPILMQMRSCHSPIERWSQVCSDTVSAILQTLVLATKDSCCAIEGSTKAVEQIVVPGGVSLKEKPTLHFNM